MSDLADAEDAGTAAKAGAPAPSRLEHFPIAFFAAVMGSAGFAIATHRVEQAFGAGAAASTGLAAFAGGLFLVLAMIYALKTLRRPAAVLAEWRPSERSPATRSAGRRVEGCDRGRRRRKAKLA